MINKASRHALFVLCAVLSSTRPCAAAGEHKGRVFVDDNGVATLTNVPNRYLGRDDFTEAIIEYDPIVVPGRYRATGDGAAHTPTRVLQTVRYYAARWGLPENLILAVIRAESNFDPFAVSPSGARGLMQLMPGTAEEMGITRIFDVAENIAGGTQYLARMLQLFDGDLELALAAYNAGPENVRRHKGVPPFRETQGYIRRVNQFFEEHEHGGVPHDALARVTGTEPRRPRPAAKAAYLVTFHSGLTQPADAVEDKDTFYYVRFRDRVYPVRKVHVKEVAKTG